MTRLAPILADLAEGAPATVEVDRALETEADVGSVAGELQRALAARDHLLAVLPGRPADERLAALRDRLWPGAHVAAIYHVATDGSVARRLLAAQQEAGRTTAGGPLTALLLASRTAALGPTATRAKFDRNAAGWNGNPGSPTYPHYRWMRRLLADVAHPAVGARVLDAGCGTGWVGIEAALMGALVSAFDPSPAMVELARRNAAEAGVDLDARVGFVEDVPFERPFDLVLNSGVISFAPDPGVYLERLDRLVAPGGRLVIGDINPAARGFRRRRRRSPLLPARELNGLPRATVVRLLEERGYAIEEVWHYQLTFPVPELMALSEQGARGLGCGLLLLLNRAAARADKLLGSRARGAFDSWIVRARKGGP